MKIHINHYNVLLLSPARHSHYPMYVYMYVHLRFSM